MEEERLINENDTTTFLEPLNVDDNAWSFDVYFEFVVHGILGPIL